jgi:hypothetical protein
MKRLILSIAIILATVTAAHAYLVQYDFTGTITQSINGYRNGEIPGYSVGGVFSGSFSYDNSVLPSRPMPWYDAYGVRCSLAAPIGSGGSASLVLAGPSGLQLFSYNAASDAFYDIFFDGISNQDINSPIQNIPSSGRFEYVQWAWPNDSNAGELWADVSINPIPEPSTVLLYAAALPLLLLYRNKKLSRVALLK